MELAARKEQDRIWRAASRTHAHAQPVVVCQLSTIQYPVLTMPSEKAMLAKTGLRSGCPCLSGVPMGIEGVVYGEFRNGLPGEFGPIIAYAITHTQYSLTPGAAWRKSVLSRRQGNNGNKAPFFSHRHFQFSSR